MAVIDSVYNMGSMALAAMISQQQSIKYKTLWSDHYTKNVKWSNALLNVHDLQHFHQVLRASIHSTPTTLAVIMVIMEL